MLYDPERRSLVGLPTLMDALGILIQEDAVKELISPYIMSVISDLSVITECIREIFAFQPSAARFEEYMADNAETLRQAWNARAKRCVILNKEIKDFASLGAPTDRRFYYPVDRRRTATSTAERRRTEANLDTFWDSVDK